RVLIVTGVQTCALPISVAVSGDPLSLGAMVGFIALFGMAARNTILLISHYDHLVALEGQPWGLATAARGAAERLTPVLLTAALKIGRASCRGREGRMVV